MIILMNKQEWQISNKSRKNRNKKPLNKDKISPEDDKQSTQPVGDNLPLHCAYVLWCHELHNNDWSLNGYKKLCTIKTVSEFWKLFNNMDKLSYKTNNLFLMKEGTDPIWEHVNNRDGGVCSFKTTMDVSLKMYEDLCVRLMCDIMTNNTDDINGVSYSPKNNWAIIKIWNKDKKNDLSVTLDQHILTVYKNTSIKYKSNEPEY